MQTVRNIGGIAYFVLLNICSFLLYLQDMVLDILNLILNFEFRITFQEYKLQWSICFLMSQLKGSW